MTNSPLSQKAGSAFLMSSVLLGCRDGILDSTHQTSASDDLVVSPRVGVAKQVGDRIFGVQHRSLQQENGCVHLGDATTLPVQQKILAPVVGGCRKGEPTKEEPFCKGPADTDVNQPVTSHLFTATPGKSQYAKSKDDYLSAYEDLDYLTDFLCKSVDSISAVRTPPANANKYKKRLGAKASKNLEKLESVGFELNPTEATLYRALSARCNYLAQDRCDIAFAAKELCREFAVPTKHSYARLKSLARYLAGAPRLVYK